MSEDDLSSDPLPDIQHSGSTSSPLFFLDKIPSSNIVFNVGLPKDSACFGPFVAIRKGVRELLAHLGEKLIAARNVAIIVDDYTRLTPTADILSILLPALHQRGVSKDAIFFIFASGSHRLMTREEKIARLGAETFATYRSLDHRFFDKTELVQHGRLPDGTPIWINRHVLGAYVKIAVGTILPHVPTSSNK